MHAHKCIFVVCCNKEEVSVWAKVTANAEKERSRDNQGEMEANDVFLPPAVWLDKGQFF